MEYLVFSHTEIYHQTNNGKMFDNGSTVDVSYYNGTKFSSRLIGEDELANYKETYNDTQIIFEGDVDETLIEVKTEGHYDVFYDARYWMEFDQKQMEDFEEEFEQEMNEF